MCRRAFMASSVAFMKLAERNIKGTTPAYFASQHTATHNKPPEGTARMPRAQKPPGVLHRFGPTNNSRSDRRATNNSHSDRRLTCMWINAPGLNINKGDIRVVRQLHPTWLYDNRFEDGMMMEG